MGNIHYFQRYTQRENVATNNTLLLFSRLYQYSPSKFKVFLSEFLNDVDLDAGIQFNQQKSEKTSVPDGTISQTSFKVSIETKLNTNNFNKDQLLNHAKGFRNEDYKVLLALSPKPLNLNLISKIEKKVKKENANIKFISTTFIDIVNKFKDVINEYEFELKEIVDDYEEFCMSSDLITDDDYKMRAVTCGWTLEENLKYNVYYSTGGFSDHNYIALYANKSIKAIGKLSNIIEANLVDDNLEIISYKHKVQDTEIEKIKQIIPKAKENNNWDISKGHNFFCVEKFYKTDYKKTSKFPLQGTKYFNLREILNFEDLPSTEEIARLLKNKSW